MDRAEDPFETKIRSLFQTVSAMTIKALLKDFVAHRWKSQPFERLLDLARGNSTSLESIVTEALVKAPKGGTFVDLALCARSALSYGNVREEPTC